MGVYDCGVLRVMVMLKMDTGLNRRWWNGGFQESKS
jgi:hypothetical protein